MGQLALGSGRGSLADRRPGVKARRARC